MILPYPYDHTTNQFQLSAADDQEAALLSAATYASLLNSKQDLLVEMTGVTFTGDPADVQRSMMYHSALQAKIELIGVLLQECDRSIQPSEA